MNTICCSGCRPDSFLSYLKAIGVFRLLSRQCDAGARLELRHDGARIQTERTRQDFEAFFLDRYAPTPVVNPWNKGGGLAKGSKSPSADKAILSVSQTKAERWAPYRASIEAARAAVDVAQSRGEMKDADKKKLIVALYRARCPEAALPWIDSAIVLGSKDAAFPPIVGSGGNDGRLDFGVTFVGYALDVISDDPRKRDRSEALLRDALYGTQTVALGQGGLGQFSPSTAVMFNLGNGSQGSSLSNPWDYVFAIEGAVAFAGALVKRASASDRPSFPFWFDSVAAGFGSASSGEDTRGEIWLPVWAGAATWPAVAALLRRGRLEVDLSRAGRTESRSARTSLDAVHGALTLGVASGLERLERVVLTARNGLAFTGTSAGAIEVGATVDPAIASLGRETLQWITRTGNLQIGMQAKSAIRAYEDAIYAYGATRLGEELRKRALQDVVVALGVVDRVVALGPPRDHRPLPFLPAHLLDDKGSLDDGSPEHQVARALASLGRFPDSPPGSRIRFDLTDVGLNAKGELVYGGERSSLWRSDTILMLAQMCARRARESATATNGSVEAHMLDGSVRIGRTTFERLLEGDVDFDRLGRLILGYSVIAPVRFRPVEQIADRTVALENEPARTREDYFAQVDVGQLLQIPSAFALLKLAFDRVRPHDHDAMPPLDSEMIPLLLSGATDRAVAIATRRLRSSGFVPRDVARTAFDPLRYPALLLIPATRRFHFVCAERGLIVNPLPPPLPKVDSSHVVVAPQAQGTLE